MNMKQIINGKMYNTETARKVFEHENDHPRNDFRFWRYAIYRKKTGEFFQAGEGGAMTEFASHCGGNMRGYGSNIFPLTEAEARELVERDGDADEYEEIFGEVEE